MRLVESIDEEPTDTEGPLYSFPMAAIINNHMPGAENNRNLFSHSPGGQKSKISVTETKSRCQRCGGGGAGC